MTDLPKLILGLLTSCFRSRANLDCRSPDPSTTDQSYASDERRLAWRVV